MFRRIKKNSIPFKDLIEKSQKQRQNGHLYFGVGGPTTNPATENEEAELEDTKGVIRFLKSKKYRQNNGQKKKYKNIKQRYTKHTHKTKDRVTRTPN
jgi:hypothetical protein